MSDAMLERTVTFRARHHYRRADLSEERNREIFGTVADPHEHEYTLTVTVRGGLDPYGFVVELDALDDAIRGAVAPLDGGDLNRAVFTDGVVQPSAEVLARWFWDRLCGRVPSGARLARVRVAEDRTLAAVWEG